MATQMWMGIPTENMQWVPCPSINSTVTRKRYVERLQFENGGGDVKRSPAYQMEYELSISGPAHEMTGVDAINKFASGFYGNGLIYLAHPANFETNMFSAAWASPGLIEGGWPNIYTNTPTFDDVPTNSYSQPIRRATWTVDTSINQPASSVKKFTIPIPPTHTLNIGASGSATGNAAIQIRPVKADGTYDVTTNLVLLPEAGSTRMNASFAGSSYTAVEVYIAKTNRTNLVVNPSFETNLNNWSSGGTLVRVTTEKYFGVASAQVNHTVSGQALSTANMATTVSKIYTASAYVKAESGKNFTIELREYQADGTTLVGTTVSSTYTGTGAWQRVSVSRTFGSLGANGQLIIRNQYAGTHTFYVDGAMFEQSSTLNPYVDSTTTDTLTLTSMMARLYVTGSSPTLTGNHYQGEGSTGLMFTDQAIVETYTYMYPPRKGISTVLAEVEAWR